MLFIIAPKEIVMWNFIGLIRNMVRTSLDRRPFRHHEDISTRTVPQLMRMDGQGNLFGLDPIECR